MTGCQCSKSHIVFTQNVGLVFVGLVLCNACNKTNQIKFVGKCYREHEQKICRKVICLNECFGKYQQIVWWSILNDTQFQTNYGDFKSLTNLHAQVSRLC